MKRKSMIFLLAAVLLLVMCVPVSADVMWEPYENSFYMSHAQEMTTVDRGYLTNGDKGYITLRSAPDSLLETANLPNGVSFRVGMTWQDGDGEVWAVGYRIVSTESGWEEYVGWVPMGDLALIYDYQEFSADHSGEFEAYDGSGDDLTEVCLYSYPNGLYVGNLEEYKDYMAFSETFRDLYTDENGLHWSFVGYYMGRQNAWVCLDDPLNQDLGTDGYLTVGQVRGGGEDLTPPAAEKIPSAKTWVVWAIPAALVVAAAVVTAVLVRRRGKANKDDHGKNDPGSES